ncbi:MAG: TetR/AcrR family transcriptional regulator [Xanthobacteraceae bacterium]|nr:TetR/AcrR family transcriptional regulator [Xanthobacteraceae bacterium]
MNDSTTRDQIVEAADRLFYRQGYDHTSFADIAGAVGISRGNFYYHFKTKDEILDAVIAARLAGTRLMLQQWEIQGKDPADRIGRFIDILIANRGDIERYGCPIGTLCSELAKLGHAAQGEASGLFTLFRIWLRRQFALLGRTDADALAMHLLARSQGVATLASAFHDAAFIRREVDVMHAWLKSCAGRGARATRPPKDASRRAVKRRTAGPRPRSGA